MIINSKNKIICDADFILALYLESDSNHDKVNTILSKYLQVSEFYVLNFTKYEVATVLSRLLPHPFAVNVNKAFLTEFSHNEIWLDKEMESKTYKLYETFSKKNISFFDCACMVLATKLNCKIASFDSFYPSEILA